MLNVQCAVLRIKMTCTAEVHQHIGSWVSDVIVAEKAV